MIDEGKRLGLQHPIISINGSIYLQTSSTTISIELDMDGPATNIQYSSFDGSDDELNQVMSLVSEDLSEPYSVYVYRHFTSELPELCFVAIDPAKPAGKQIVGCIVCNTRDHRSRRNRGYIAMLAVNKDYRGHGIGSKLAQKAIEALRPRVDEIILETEVTNKGALRLYENLGFLRTKRFHRYYLNGNDALRLILPITERSTVLTTFLPELTSQEKI